MPVTGIFSIASATTQNYLRSIRAAGKFVTLASDQMEGFEVPSATPDNASGITEAVEHLLAHGHTRIGFAANLIQPDMKARHAAYCAAMVAQGLDPHAKWFFDAFDNGELGDITNYYGRFFSMYGSDPMGLLSWRFLVDQAGHGVGTDILSHSVDLGHYLVGGIAKVSGTGETFIKHRPLPTGGQST